MGVMENVASNQPVFPFCIFPMMDFPLFTVRMWISIGFKVISQLIQLRSQRNSSKTSQDWSVPQSPESDTGNFSQGSCLLVHYLTGDPRYFGYYVCYSTQLTAMATPGQLPNDHYANILAELPAEDREITRGFIH